MRTSVGLVTISSDETLLREIDSRIIEWNKKSSTALINSQVDDYRLHKIQVQLLLLLLYSSLIMFIFYTSPSFF